MGARSEGTVDLPDVVARTLVALVSGERGERWGLQRESWCNTRAVLRVSMETHAVLCLVAGTPGDGAGRSQGLGEPRGGAGGAGLDGEG